MATKRALRAEIDRLQRLRDSDQFNLEWDANRLDRITKRMKAEYEKHTPRQLDDYHLTIDMRPEGVKARCQSCTYYWPCPAWHMLRRINGWDDAEYEMVIRRIEPKEGE